MIITLIALAILMIGGVALVRSLDTSMLLAGNLAFKRDLMNQGERGMAQAITVLSGGALATEGARTSDSPANNYSATALTSDARGVPRILIGSTPWTYTAPDITDATSGVTIRYVIDRQCAGGTVAFNSAACNAIPTEQDKGGSSWLKKAGGPSRPVYRISVRVDGPRNTQAYLQSTLAL